MGTSASARRAPARVRRLAVTPELLRMLQQKDVLTLKEAEALGYGRQAELRAKVAAGTIKRAVVWQGVGTDRRRFRLLRATLLEELQEQGR